MWSNHNTSRAHHFLYFMGLSVPEPGFGRDYIALPICMRQGYLDFLITNPVYELTFHLTLYQVLRTLRKKPFENIVGKGENAGN